uniref:tumor necrosis factor receptor superfamily member 14-like n=1 Tax=Semicossyphus pulcher TaxID=241346 RepID=UPI0037E95334
MVTRWRLWSGLLLIQGLNVLRGDGLTCDQSEYPIEDRCCSKCPHGRHVETDCFIESNTTICQPCPKGTFMTRPTDRRQCFRCRNCAAGSGLRIKTSCTQTSNTVCETLEGFYCTVFAEDGCAAARSYTSCRPGQYIRQRGTSQRDTECSDCGGGTFSDGTFTSCRPHTRCESKFLQLLEPGTDSTDAQCGGLNSDGILVIICVVGLFLLTAVGLSVFYPRKKKTSGLYKGRDRRTQTWRQFLGRCRVNVPQDPLIIS